MMFKKNKKGFAGTHIIIALTFIASMITLIGYYSDFNVASIVGGADYIQAPYFATISCEQSGTAKSFSSGIATSGNWISDHMPSNTNEWAVTLTGGSGISGKRFEWYVCPQRSIRDNCARHFQTFSSSGGTANVGVVSSDEFIWSQYQTSTVFGYREFEGATFKVTYKPFVLEREDRFRGGITEVAGALGCEVPYSDSSWQNRVISSVGLNVDVAVSRDLQVGEKFNYISGTVTRLAEGNLQDGGYCIYSNGQAKIYPIAELRTASGDYNVVDTSSSPIATAQCCTGSNLPDKTCVDGIWESTLDAECSLLNSCEGTEWRGDLTDNTQAIKYQCVSGSCELQYKDVDCTVDSQCSTNQYCDTNTFTCKDASVVGGEGEVRVPLSQTECIEKDGNWIPQQTEETGFFGFGKTVVVEAHCDLDNEINWILWIALGSLVVIGFFFRGKLIAGFRFLLGKIGVGI